MDEEQDPSAGVSSTDADVVQAAVVAESHGPGRVDDVPPGAEMGTRQWATVDVRLRPAGR